jgi:hypothetical protein
MIRLAVLASGVLLAACNTNDTSSNEAQTTLNSTANTLDHYGIPHEKRTTGRPWLWFLCTTDGVACMPGRCR